MQLPTKCYESDAQTVYCATFQSHLPAVHACVDCPVFGKAALQLSETQYHIGDRVKARFASEGWVMTETCMCEHLRQQLNNTNPTDILDNIEYWVDEILPNVQGLTGAAGVVAKIGTAIFPNVARQFIRDTLHECVREASTA